MAAKVVELTSGTVITKHSGNGYDEIWEIESKAIANTIVTLDMSSCTGCVVDGHEGEQTITEKVGPMEKRCLFYILLIDIFNFKKN